MAASDFLIIGVYLLAVVTVGAWFSRSQKSLKDYFLGGRNIPWWAAAFSGIATLVSAASYLSAPGVSFEGDFTLHQYRLGLPIAIPVLALIVLPVLYRKQRFSIYQYLEERFDLKTRLFTSALFLVLKTCYLGIAIAAPAFILKHLLDVSIWPVVIFIGLVTTIYTLLGGIKGVIWTDTLQLTILIGGLFAVVAFIISRMDGGLPAIIEIGRAEQKFRFLNLSMSLTERYTALGGLIGGAFFLIMQYGTDQAELQRFLTTRTLKDANIAIIVTIIVTALFGFLVFFIGTALFAFYTQNPGSLEPGLTSNEIFPLFMVRELPAGLKGLLVASILAAAMSTISTVVNSVATVGIADFYNRFSKCEASVLQARIVTLGIGLIGILLAGLAGSLGNILELSMMVSSFFGGPLVGVFLLGMLTRRAHANPAFIALCLGMAAAVALGTLTPVSFLWFGAFSSLITLGVGFVLSLLWANPRASSPP